MLTTLASALVVVGVLILIRSFFILRLANGERESFQLERRHKVAAVAIGAGTGYVIGMTSAGSGTVIAVCLIVLYRMAPRQVVGTDVFHAAILLWAAGIAHWVGGNIDFALVGTILLGSLPGVWLGSHLTTRLPTGLLRAALGIVMIGSAMALFEKAGVDIPLAVMIGLPVLLACAFGVQQLVHRSRTLKTSTNAGSA